MGEPLQVRPESGRRDRSRFFQLPYRLYRGHPTWVPPLRMAERALLSRTVNPFFQHASAQHFLATRGRRVVGRIAAIDNPNHAAVHESGTGFFGFLDLEPDPECARALLDAAAAWCAQRGLSRMRGPVNYSTNDGCGVLVEGFDDPPFLLMPYNRPDYDELVRGAGLVPLKDLVTYWLRKELEVPPRFERVVDRKLERAGVVLRPLNLKDKAYEVSLLKDLYNRSWERNWGFIPATDAEFNHAAADLSRLVEPRLSCIAERHGEPVGFSVFLRDVNELLRGTSGRLFPTLWWKLLTGLERTQRYRCVLLGIVPQARRLAINEAFFVHALRACKSMDMTGVEAGWILEDNHAIQSPIQAVGGTLNKRYRIYERAISPTQPLTA